MRKLFFPLATLCLSLLLGACEGKDSTPSNLSAEEGKEVIQTSSKSMSTEMQDMQNHPSFAALESLALLESPVPFLTDFDFSDFEGLADLDTYKKASSTKKQLSFGKKTLKKNDYAPTEEEFDFASAVGTYNWNSTNQNWDISLGSPADKVIVNKIRANIGSITSVMDSMGR